MFLSINKQLEGIEVEWPINIFRKNDINDVKIVKIRLF